MEWAEIVNQIFQLVVIPLMGILTAQVVKFAKARMNEAIANTKNETLAKYMALLQNTIVNCVEATNQTYVESLKEGGKFDAEAQKVAFNKTLQAVTEILGDEAKIYLTEAVGDLNTYISTLIEATVAKVKAGKVE